MMKSFMIAIGLVGIAGRVQAQQLTMFIGTVKVGVDSIVVAATDFGVVRVEATDSGRTREVDAAPLAARDYAGAFGYPRSRPAEDTAHGHAVRMTDRLSGPGGAMWIEWHTIDAHTTQTVLAIEPPGEQPTRLDLREGTAIGGLMMYLAEAAKETAGLSAAPTGIDSSRAGEYGFQDFQVEQQAHLWRYQIRPLYPPVLIRKNVQGDVVARFLVTARGVVDTSTIQILSSPDEQLSASVKHALAHEGFMPARIGNRLVGQWVQTTFPFRLAGHAGE